MKAGGSVMCAQGVATLMVASSCGVNLGNVPWRSPMGWFDSNNRQPSHLLQLTLELHLTEFLRFLAEGVWTFGFLLLRGSQI